MGKIELTGCALVLGLLLGCDRESPRKDLTFADMGHADVVVVVNDEPVTWREIKEQLNLEYQRMFWENRGRKPDESDPFYLKFRPWRIRGLVNDMINTRLFEQAAERSGIEVGEEEFAREEKTYIERMTMFLHLKGKPTLADVERALPVREGLLSEVLHRDVRRQNYLAAQDSRITNITDRVLAESRKRVADYNAGVMATNEFQQVRLRAIRQQILDGADFVDLGKKVTEYGREEEKHWDALTWEDFADRKLNLKLRDWAFSAKVGDISEPLMTGQGYSIFKLTRHDDGVREASAAATRLERVYLSRITLAAFKKIEVTDDASTRKRMMSTYLMRAMQENLSKLRRSSRIYYPNGTNLCERLPDWFGEPPVHVK